MPKTIKVLQLGSPSGLYGAEFWILALIKHLDPNIIESWVGSIKDIPGSNPPLCKEAEKYGFPTCVIESIGKLNFSAAKRLKKFILENNIDILHTHGYKTDFIGWLATINTPCKIISTPHGWTQKPDFKLFLYEMMDRMIFPFLDAVVPLSDGIYKPLQLIPGLKKKLHLIVNGTDISEIDSIDTVSDKISKLKEKGFFIIGYIGRLTTGKGLDVLLRAVAENVTHNWKVIIIGEGDQEKELKTLVNTLNLSEKVEFLGFREDRLSLLKGFDTFVLPSRSEGIPRCLMEAMSANVPVIASDIPGCRNLVDGVKTGLLFKIDDHLQLEKLLVKLYTDSECRKRLTKHGKEFIHKHFSAERMAKEYQKLFIEITNL